MQLHHSVSEQWLFQARHKGGEGVPEPKLFLIGREIPRTKSWRIPALIGEKSKSSPASRDWEIPRTEAGLNLEIWHNIY